MANLLKGDIITDTDTFTIPAGTQVRTQYCQRVGYQWTAYNNSAYSNGAWACMVAASPYLSIVGGNAWAGVSDCSYSGIAAIAAAALVPLSSFDEYGVFATGTVDYFGSARSARKCPHSPWRCRRLKTDVCKQGSSLGTFTTSHAISNLVSYYAGSSHTASVLGGAGNTTVQGSGVYMVAGTGTVTLSSIAANANPHAVIYAPQGTVLINGTLVYTYAGALTFKDLPSLTVIADTIVVTAPSPDYW